MLPLQYEFGIVCDVWLAKFGSTSASLLCPSLSRELALERIWSVERYFVTCHQWEVASRFCDLLLFPFTREFTGASLEPF